MDVYRGREHVATVNDFNDVKLGKKNIPFVRRGADVLHPGPIRDGLVLWYDFSGMTNNDDSRGVAEDLSGNGNHGTLQNFNYTAESGYDNGLKFDGVDDEINSFNVIDFSNGISIELVVKYDELETNSQDIIHFYTNGKRLLRFSWNYMKYFFSWTSIETDVNTTVNYIEPEVFTEGDSFQHVIVTITENGLSKGYINGIEEPVRNPQLEITGSIIEQGADEVSYKGSKNHLLSSKIYNRPLTPEEIQHNYAIEKERFNIE